MIFIVDSCTKRSRWVNHQGLFPEVAVAFNLKPGVALCDAVNATTAVAARVTGARFRRFARPGYIGMSHAVKKRMKQEVDEGIQMYATVSDGDQARPEGSAGQSGDTQGLSDVAEAGSESVAELIEEGQFFEADAIGGVEDAPDADVAEVHTKQVAEDDVPPEYLEGD
jgi:hypothetical protein